MAKRRNSWLTSEVGGLPMWGLIALVAMLVVGGGWAASIALTRDTTPAEARTPWTPPPPDDEETLRIAFIGDSWAGGTGADPSGEQYGYPGLTSNALGWPHKTFAGGGTGYTKDNDAGQGTFGDRVDAVVAWDPDVVVVQGSSNDYAASSSEIEAAAVDLFSRLRSSLPDAQIFALGAIDSPSSNDESMTASRTAVAEAAAQTGVTWIDGNAEAWLSVETDFADGYHPNNEGHQKVAERLAAKITEWYGSRNP